MKGNESKKVWLILDGKIVTDHKIEAFTFGKLLTRLQRVIDSIQEAKYRGHKKKDFVLYLTDLEPGSVAAAFQPMDFPTDLFDGTIIFDKIVYNFQDLVKTLATSTDEFRRKIDAEFEDSVDKIRFLENFKGMLSKRNKFSVNIGYAAVKPINTISLPAHREGYIQDLISEYYESSSVEVKGIITRIKGDEPRSFTIRTQSNDTIRCVYSSETEKDVMALFKSPVIVKGILNQKMKVKEMETLKEVRPFNSFTFEQIGEFPLLQPLIVRVSYHDKDEQWCLENEELTLSGYGSSFDDAQASLKESLESLIIGILTFNDDILTERSKVIKKNLQKYLDLNRMVDLIKGVEIES